MGRLGFLLTYPMIVQAAFLPLFGISNITGTENLTTSFGRLPSFRGHCVDESLFSGWDGALNNDDCFVAQKQLEMQAKHNLDQRYTFWSREFNIRPPRDGFILPVLAHYSMFFLRGKPQPR